MTMGGILLPSMTQSKPQGDWGTYYLLQYAGTEVEFNDLKHLILKEDYIVGLRHQRSQVFIKVAEAEEKTAGETTFELVVVKTSNSSCCQPPKKKIGVAKIDGGRGGLSLKEEAC
ncbi:Uncharacterized protein Rs2_28398 [Raphanus sativus]|nr:Uncharacterized protein Rs2_28398 [Raphanus sativus]